MREVISEGVNPVTGGLIENRRGDVRFHHVILAPNDGVFWAPHVSNIILNPDDPHGKAAQIEAKRQAGFVTRGTGVQHASGFINEGQTYLNTETGQFYIHGVTDHPVVAGEHLTAATDAFKGIKTFPFAC